MKQERIEELLANTPYANGLVANPYCPKRSALYDDAEVNAARVQLLAKALIRLRDCDWVISLPDRMDAVRDIARAALKEAGLEG